MDNRDDDSDSTAAERAFEALRAEVAGMRRALERLPETIKKLAPIDYTETLGAIAKNLEIVGSFMTAIEQHPVIRMGGAQYERMLAGAGEGLVHKSARALDQAAADAVKERRELTAELSAIIGSARTQDKQIKGLMWTGGIALLFGVLASPIFAHLLPFGWDGRVAAIVMNADRWTAGSTLMQAENPEAWRGLMDDFNLVKSNRDVVGGCLAAAAKTKKEQHCSIVVHSGGD
jgi:hypothetical protein